MKKFLIGLVALTSISAFAEIIPGNTLLSQLPTSTRKCTLALSKTSILVPIGSDSSKTGSILFKVKRPDFALRELSPGRKMRISSIGNAINFRDANMEMSCPLEPSNYCADADKMTVDEYVKLSGGNLTFECVDEVPVQL